MPCQAWKYVPLLRRVSTASTTQKTLLFAHTPRIPTFRASSASWGDMCIDTIRMGTRGERCVIDFAASKPFISGIWKSRTITSVSSCLAFSTASRPSEASPQTVQCGCRSNRCRRPRRIAWLSSTTKMRVGEISVNISDAAILHGEGLQTNDEYTEERRIVRNQAYFSDRPKAFLTI